MISAVVTLSIEGNTFADLLDTIQALTEEMQLQHDSGEAPMPYDGFLHVVSDGDDSVATAQIVAHIVQDSLVM